MPLSLPPEPATLAQWQQYTKDACAEYGWDKNSHLAIFLLLTEEVGELAQAVRHKQNDKQAIANELADVFNYLTEIANYFDIDLENAIRHKWTENAQRSWK